MSSTAAERKANKAAMALELAHVDALLAAKADQRWNELAHRDLACGDVHGGRSPSRHPCARPFGHDPKDRYGHVCRCEAEQFLERYSPCAATPLEVIS